MSRRPSTQRDYRERINRVIFFIERKLDERLELCELARVACFSPFHFHRIFCAFTGERPADFIRRLRLERAALQLQHLDAPVTEIGLNAGYETPAAFSRAFARHFGASPSAYRKSEAPAAPRGAKPLKLSHEEKEGPPMEAEIRKVEDQQVLFVRRTGPYDKAAEAAFRALCAFAGPRGLLGPRARFIGISHDDPGLTATEQLRYDACVTVDRLVKAEGEVATKTIAGGRYAVFPHAGPYEGLSQTYDRIFADWLPRQKEELRDEPSLELYLNSPGQVRPKALRTEIWIPLR